MFDANTPYKHREVLGNSCYIYEFDDLFCAWQNFFEEATCTVTVQLDFFSEENGHYIREQEYIVERAYTQEELSQWRTAGFKLLAVYGEDSFGSAGARLSAPGFLQPEKSKEIIDLWQP